MVTQQLALPVGVRGGPTLTNFEPGPNREALAAIEAAARGEGPACVYLWGPGGCGKTHLLQAALASAQAGGRAAGYVPLDAAGLDPPALTGLESLGLLGLDAVETVAGDEVWEEALFHLYNRCEAAGTVLLVGARAAPSSAGFHLADLATRLGSGMVFRLRALDDAARSAALRRRARERGFELPPDAAAYLLRRHPRDMHSLMAVLERLDGWTLRAKRKVSVALLKALLRAAPD